MTIELIEVKVSELSGAALDWAVAKACGIDIYRRTGGMISEGEVVLMLDDHSAVFAPSTDWSQGGPLIDKYRVELNRDGETQCRETGYWGYAHGAVSWSSEDTALIAACRAIVASVLGDTVSVPKELIHE